MTLLTQLEYAVEQKALDEVEPLIGESFKGKLRYDRKKVLSLLRLHFLRRRSIHVLARVTSLSFPTPDSASVIVYAGLAGRAVKSPGGFAGLGANLMRFHLQMTYDDQWRIVRANWNRVRLSDFVREAKSALRGDESPP